MLPWTGWTCSSPAFACSTLRWASTCWPEATAVNRHKKTASATNRADLLSVAKSCLIASLMLSQRAGRKMPLRTISFFSKIRAGDELICQVCGVFDHGCDEEPLIAIGFLHH